ncbi:MAG: aldehyde dehydrogenase, partial [bacterium]
MTPLSNEQIESIAARIAGMIDGKPIPVMAQVDAPTAVSGDGIFQDIDSAVNAAREAHLKLMDQTLAQRNIIIEKIRTEMLEHAEDLAKRAHAETGLGRVEDKILKNRLVAEKTPGTEMLKPTAYTGDRGLTLVELAPYGVIGTITPVTNPTSTIICNSIGMLAAGNAVVFNVHPSAKNVSNYNIQLLNKVIVEAGGPPNLVTAIAEPTVESAQKLMQHPGVRLLVVTGGAGVVKAAMTSGKRAICAGPGNPPVVVDETADIEAAARDIVRGASMDNNIICVDEKEVFVVDSVADKLLEAFSRNNAVVLNPE